MTHEKALALCSFPDVEPPDYGEMSRISETLKKQADALASDDTLAEAAELLRGQLTLGDRLSKTNDFHEILSLCLDAAIAVDDMDCGGVYLAEDEKLVLAAHSGLSDDFVDAVREFDAGDVRYELVMAGEPLYYELGSPELHALGTLDRDPDMHALAIIPVRAGGEVIGCLNVGSHSAEAFPPFIRVALECVTHQLADVVARAVATRNLEREMYRYQALSQAGFDAILIHLESEVVAANRAWTALTGWTESETRKRGLYAFFSPDTVGEVRRRVRTNTTGAYEASVITRDGRSVPVEVAVHNVRYNGRRRPCRAKVITPLTPLGDADAP